MKKKKRPEETVPCPWCGHDVPVRAKSCPECGSDGETGWKDPEDLITDTADLSGDELTDAEYDDFLKREWGSSAGRDPWTGRRMLVLVIAFLIVLGLFLLLSR